MYAFTDSELKCTGTQSLIFNTYVEWCVCPIKAHTHVQYLSLQIATITTIHTIQVVQCT